MEVLKLGGRIMSNEPRVELDPELRPGKYRVGLVVRSARGSSEPAQITLIVRERPRGFPSNNEAQPVKPAAGKRARRASPAGGTAKRRPREKP